MASVSVPNKTTRRDPLRILRDLERRCRLHAVGLPLQIDERKEWLGIGFRLGDATLVAPLDDVKEILHYPNVARVPGTKSWVKGIANVRGNLLPIMDLQGYLRGDNAAMDKRSRVLVLNHNGVFTGLVVTEVLGLKHFVEDELSAQLPPVDGSITPYLESSYAQRGALWGVFNMQRLAENPAFIQAGI
ncbi:MAG: chemotaxis protein CheW [Gammaproteobacteria bacterium]